MCNLPDRLWSKNVNKPDLLRPDEIIVTSSIDPGHTYYAGWMRRFMQRRLSLVADMLAGRNFSRLLDVGYASGIFLPHLVQAAGEVHGIDIHPHQMRVEGVLRRRKCPVMLKTASVTATGYPDRHFDALVAVSTIECVHPMEDAIRELRRIATPGARLYICAPVRNQLYDAIYCLLEPGKNLQDIYADNRERLAETVARHFTLCRRFSDPPLPLLAMYQYIEAVAE